LSYGCRNSSIKELIMRVFVAGATGAIGKQLEMVRKRKFPLVGDGGGVWSFIHVADAAEATVAAIDHGSRGVYNVVDDDPAPVAEWLPARRDAVIIVSHLSGPDARRIGPSVRYVSTSTNLRAEMAAGEPHNLLLRHTKRIEAETLRR